MFGSTTVEHVSHDQEVMGSNGTMAELFSITIISVNLFSGKRLIETVQAEAQFCQPVSKRSADQAYLVSVNCCK